MDGQVVQPLRQADLIAADRLRGDQLSGNSGALARDSLAVDQASQALINAQTAAAQAVSPQQSATLQADLQSRNQLVAAAAAAGVAQQQPQAARAANSAAVNP